MADVLKIDSCSYLAKRGKDYVSVKTKAQIHYFICYNLEFGWHVTRPNQRKESGNEVGYTLYNDHINVYVLKRKLFIYARPKVNPIYFGINHTTKNKIGIETKELAKALNTMQCLAGRTPPLPSPPPPTALRFILTSLQLRNVRPMSSTSYLPWQKVIYCRLTIRRYRVFFVFF